MQKKNLILPPPHLEIASEAVAGAGSADYRDDEPDSCRCEMSVDSVSGGGVYDEDYWRIQDQTGSPPVPFQIYGSEESYYPVPSPSNLEPLPSDFRTLNSPSDGNHDFYLSMMHNNTSTDPLDLVLYTVVKCYDIVDSEETLATTTYHQFAMDEGDLVGAGGGIYVVEICKKFACTVLAAGFDSCRN